MLFLLTCLVILFAVFGEFFIAYLKISFAITTVFILSIIALILALFIS